MVNIAICDDDELILEYIEMLIRKMMGNELKIFKHNNGYALELHVDEILKGNIDILFIDIDLVTLNGIEVAKRLKTKYPDIKIIFITGRIDYAQNIFESRPTYFLVKPIQEDKLALAIDTAMRELKNDVNQTISFASKGHISNIALRDIKYIESSRRIITIHEFDINREVYGKLDEIEELLPSSFLRCHQSYIVNMDRVRHLNMNYFLLNTGEEVPISQSRYNNTRKIFMDYLGNSL